MAGVPWRCTLSAYSAKKRSTVRVDLAHQPFLMPLRTIARCLRGMASMLASSSGRSSRLRKVTYRSCGASPGGAARHCALEVVDAELAGHGLGLGFQRRDRGLIDRRPRRRRRRTAGRDQRIAEQQLFTWASGSTPDDAIASLGIQEVGVVPKDLADDALPARTVEEGGLRDRPHEGVPALRGLVAGGRETVTTATRGQAGTGSKASRLMRRTQEDLVHAPPAEIRRRRAGGLQCGRC
jgi:hypothetical protein